MVRWQQFVEQLSTSLRFKVGVNKLKNRYPITLGTSTLLVGHQEASGLQKPSDELLAWLYAKCEWFADDTVADTAISYLASVSDYFTCLWYWLTLVAEKKLLNRCQGIWTARKWNEPSIPHRFFFGGPVQPSITAEEWWCLCCMLLTEPGVVLSHNKSERFESRFVTVRINESPSVMLAGMQNSVLGIWVAHGEGKFYKCWKSC